MNNKVYAIILAAGSGRRMGTSVPKQYLMLEGKPVLAHTIAAFDKTPLVDGLFISAHLSYHSFIMDEIIYKYRIKKPVELLEGGAERQITAHKSLKALPADTDIAVIHDGVRPLITPEAIELAIKGAAEFGAAAIGMPVKDTIKQVDDKGFSEFTPDRSRLWMVHTPQAFKFELILKAYDKAMEEKFSATDDTMVFERFYYPVKMIEGGYDNIKITTQEDLLFAAGILKGRR